MCRNNVLVRKYSHSKRNLFQWTLLLFHFTDIDVVGVARLRSLRLLASRRDLYMSAIDETVYTESVRCAEHP